MKILDIRGLELSYVTRAKFQTLTEQMFYTLLCLKEECYGMDILDKVPAMTNHRVNVGSGTLYTLLEQRYLPLLERLEAGEYDDEDVEQIKKALSEVQR
mgnify:CR=1 FL=1